MELNINGTSGRGKPKLKFALYGTNDLDEPDKVCHIGGICLVDEAYQADFDLSIQEIDMLIGFLKGMRKHITENQD